MREKLVVCEHCEKTIAENAALKRENGLLEVTYEEVKQTKSDLLDKNKALRRENKRYSAALYDALCLQVEHDDDIFSDIRLDHLMGVALLTGDTDD